MSIKPDIITDELSRVRISFSKEFFGYDLITCPMHPSEWNSILYNLYTNSKKAIRRANQLEGKIKIICGEENDILYLEFLDNGDGIPFENQERIFDPFFTTATPASIDSSESETASGTGLGLKIVKDIVESYLGNIDLIGDVDGYTTCFRVEIPKATHNEIEDYDN